MYSTRQGMAKQLKSLVGSVFICTLVASCGGGSGGGTDANSGSQPPTTGEPANPTPTPSPSTLRIVPFDFQQKAQNQQFRGNIVQKASFVNATGGFRLPIPEQNLSGNLTIAIDLEDPDGITSAYVGFNGAATAIQLCNQDCNATTYQKTLTGINPLDHGRSSGPLQLNLMVGDTAGNLTTVSTVSFFWQVNNITGLSVDRQAGAINLNWNGISNYLRYNVYTASQDGVTSENYQSMPDGQAILAVRDPSLVLTGKEDAKTFYATVTGVNGSGESAFGEVAKIVALAGSIDNPPTAGNDNYVMDEDTVLSQNLLDNDTDAESQTLTVNTAPLRSPENGTLTINSDGTFTYTPLPDFNGRDNFRYQVSDGLQQTDEADVIIVVNQGNDAPESFGNNYNFVGVVARNASDNTDTGSLQNRAARRALTVDAPGLLINDLDIDNNSMSIVTTPVADPTQGTLQLFADGSFIYDANPGATGEDSFTYQSSDGNGGIAEATVRITINGDSFFPRAATDRYVLTEGDTFVADNSAADRMSILDNDTDLDTGDVLTLNQNLIRSPTYGTVNMGADGTFTYIPNAGFYGTDSLVYEITDQQNHTAQAGVIFTINRRNDPPIAAADTYTIDEDLLLTVDAASGVMSNDSDVDFDPLTIDVTPIQAPGNGQLTLASDGSFSYQPDANFFGSDSFTYQISDGNATAQGTVTLTVTNVNDPPVANNDTVLTSIDTAININVLANDTDVENQTLTIVSAAANNGTVSINADSTLTYTPPAGFEGSAQIDYSIDDGGGVTASATVAVTVSNTNQLPTAGDDGYATNEDQTLDINAQALPLLTANDSDPEGNTLTVNTTPVNDVANGILILSADGSFQYTPSNNFFGNDSFVYEVNDGFGGTATATVSITVNSVNDAPVANNDTIATSEETLININVLANDSDADNDALTITSATATNGGVTIVGDGTINYTPNFNFNGNDTITYGISDNNGGTAAAQVLVNVINVNDLPTAQNDTGQTLESTPVTINVLANDSDIDGDALSVLAANATSGSVVINGDNTLTYTPNFGFNGSETISYTISDGNGGTAAASVFVTVTSVNDNPTALNDSITIDEDSPAVVNVLANDSDIDGDTLTVTSASAGNGNVTVNSDNTLTYIPQADFNGSDTIDYAISDGQGGSAQAQVFMTINAVNDNPVANADSATTNEDTLVNINVLANDSDVDNNLASLTVSSAVAGSGSVSILPDQSLNYQPTANFSGVDTITYQVSDGAGGSASSTVTITVIAQNDPPVALNDGTTISEDFPANINVLANDSDPDNDPLTVTSATAGNGTVSINSDNTLTYTPNANFNGSEVINYQISDTGGLTATAVVNITVTSVNDLPVAQNDTAVTSEDLAVTIDILANDSDIESTVLTITSAAAQNGQVSVVANNMLEYTPAANFNGTDTINYSIADADGGTASAQVLVTVSGVNDLPVAQADTASTNEDVSVTIDVLANDSDADGDTISVAQAQAQNGAVTVVGGGINYVPNANFNGNDTINYSISDGRGGVASSTVAVTVNAVNDVPVAVNDSAVVNEDSQTVVNVLANDNDIDGDTLIVTNATATSGSVVINSDQTLNYTPNGNFNGSDTINYTISDGNGGTASSTVALSITATNDQPVANADAVATNEDTSVTIDVLANDTDIDGDTLTVANVSASNGSVSVNTDQTIAYAPNANFNGPDVINYTVSDGNGGSAQSAVSVTVNAVNDTPVAVSDSAITDEDTAINLNVLINDTDIDGDTLGIVTASAENGTATFTSTTIDYTPNANFNGVDTVTYSITDSQGGNAEATVLVTVNAVNDVPVAVSDTATTSEDTAVTISVLSNDTDLDNDNLTVQSATAQNGQTVVNSNGTVTYTPNANFNGSDSINYTITDNQGGTASAVVAVTVTSVNDVPVANSDTATTDEDVTVSINVLSNDTDLDGDTLTITNVTSSEGVVSIDSSNNTVSYTPTGNFNGNVTINYSISDGNGGTASSTVAVTVNPINDHPTIVADTHTTDEDVTSNIDPLANDSDIDGDTLSIVSATANNGTVTIQQAAAKLSRASSSGANAALNSTHTLNYVPNANYNGQEIITYNISDGNGGTATSTVTVTINPVNDVPVAVADTAATNEDTAVTVNVLANDTDADGETLTVQSATAVNGAVVINSDQTLTYTPNANFNGSDTINYTITDPANVTASSTVSVTVNAVNDNPVAVNDTATVDEDNSVTVSVLSNDTDVENQALTVTSASATNGSAQIVNAQQVTFTPTANFNGNATVTYNISDGDGGTATATVAIVVNPINDNPVAVNDTASTNEDTLVNFAVLTNDTDVDGDTLSVTAASAQNGSVTVQPDKSLNYSPNTNFNGTDTINYTVADGNGGTATASVTVSIAAVNDVPVAVADTATTNEDTLVNIAALTNDSDVDNNVLTLVSVSAGNGSAVIVNDTTINYTPNTNFNGSDTINYTISDGNGGTASSTVTVTINAVNDAPVANVDTATTAEDTLTNINVIANDTDIEVDSLTVTSATATNGNVQIQANQSLNYTPNANFNGSDTINYSISDGNGGTSQSTVAVTITAVNDAPLAFVDTGTTLEDTKTNFKVLDNDTDVENDTLTITSAGAQNGVVAVLNGTTIDYTPNSNYNGTDTLVYGISDGNGGTAAATVTITVTPVNDNPVANPDTFTATEDTLSNITVIANDTDVDGDTLTVTRASATKGSIIIQNNNSLNYTPNANEVGTDTIEYDISDGNGGSASSTVTVTISAVNDSPIAINDSVTTNEDTLVNIKVLDNDSDPENNTLTITGTSTASNGIASVVSGTTINYTPNSNYHGSDSFTYTVSDGVGGTATGTVTVTVTSVNDNPVAVNDTTSVTEDNALNILVLANDSDPDGDTLTITAANAPNGNTNFSTGTSLDYTPNSNFNGTETISYTISDGNGGTATATVTVNVTAINDAPVANNDSATTNEDTLVNINVLANDSDVDGDTLSILSQSASNGVLTLKADQSLDYVPNVNFNGTDTINYTVSDDSSLTNSATVTVTVTSVNDSPVYANQTASVAENSANGTAVVTMTGTDVDTGDTLTYSIQTNSSNIFAINSATGAITVADNSSLNYETAIRHDLVVKVTDAAGASDTANATINVTNVEENVTPTLDSTFGTSGIAATNAFATENYDKVTGAVLDASGKMVVAGYIGYSNSDLYLARFNTDGTLDRTFGHFGIVNKDFGQSDQAVAVAIDSSSRIVVAGNYNTGSVNEVFVARYTSAGVLDTSFNSAGYRITSFGSSVVATDMKIASDGSILVSANTSTDMRLINFAADGSSQSHLDIDFSGGTDLVYSLAIQSDGKVLLTGASTPTPAFAVITSDFAVARVTLTAPMALDSSYGSGGKATVDVMNSDIAYASLITSGDELVIAGGSDTGGGQKASTFAKLDSSGSLVSSFAGSGKMLIDINSNSAKNDEIRDIKSDSSGNLFFAIDNSQSNVDASILKTDASGGVISSFGTSGLVTFDYNSKNNNLGQLLIDGSDRPNIAVLGSNLVEESTVVARFTTAGVLDTTFSTDGMNIIDPTFGVDLMVNMKVLTASPNAGKYVAVGSTAPGRLIVGRFTSTGAVDETFGTNGFYTLAHSEGSYIGFDVAELSDGRLVVSGSQDSYGIVLMLKTDGTLDTTFGSSGQVMLTGNYGLLLSAIAIDKNNKIVVGGTNSDFSGGDVYMARLNLDGSFDTNSDSDPSLSFNLTGYTTFDLGLDETIEGLTTQSDGSIIAVGRKGGSAFVIKFLENGDRDTSGFASPDGYVSIDLDSASSTELGMLTRVQVKSDGKIVASGFTSDSGDTGYVVQLLANGLPDTSFNSSGVASHNYGSGNFRYLGLALDSQERIILTGENSNGSNFDIFVARITATGVKDTLFNTTGGKLIDHGGEENAHVVRVLGDGSLLVAGSNTLNTYATPSFYIQKLKLVEP